MRTNPVMRRVLAAVVALVSSALLATPAVAQDVSGVVVQDLDTSAYPTVRLKVSLPDSFGDQEASFEILENGEPVENVDAERISAPPKVALVIDTSGSMRGQPMEDAKAAARQFVDALAEDALVAIVAFSDAPRVASDFGADVSARREAIEGLAAGGSTSLFDAIGLAVKALGEGDGGPRAVVVLSDGADVSSKLSFDGTMSLLREAGVPLYAVALKSKDYNPRALETLAASSGGRTVSAAASSELATLFEGIAEQIGRTYQLEYASARPSTKDVDVDVRASAGDVSGSAALVYPQPDFLVAQDLDVADVVMPRVGEDVGVLALATMLAFGAVALLAAGALMIFLREPTGLKQLRYYDQLHASGSGADTGMRTDQVRTKVVAAVDAVAAKRGLTQAIGEKLEQAGLPLRPAEYMTAHTLGVVALGALTQLLVGNFVLSFGMVVAATMIPLLALDIAVERRRARFERQLPDILSMIAVSLRGGWGLLQSVEFVGQQVDSPAAEEFRRVQTEVRLGIPIEEALESMAARLRSQEFDAAVAAMLIQREVGGNLAEILDIVGKTVRDRSALRRQVSALTAEGRLSAVILMALPFLEFTALFFVSPGYLDPLYTTLPGILMSVGAILLLVIGGVWLRSVTKIEV